MSQISPYPRHFAGVDAISFDNRTFEVSRQDIENICFFFNIGKLQHYEKEKGIVVSHSNFIVFVTTGLGQFVLKLFPANAAKSIAIEYAINRFLRGQHFLTPAMHQGHNNRPFIESNGRLAACFSYIDGSQAWECIHKPGTIHQLNSAIFLLKETLQHAPANILCIKQGGLLKKAGNLAKTSKELTLYDRKALIDQTLKNICQTYRDHRRYFTRLWLHNNTTLTNFIISKKTVHTLDLSHIKEDYILSDLASLVISCLFLGVPLKIQKAIIQDYYKLHAINTQQFPVLNALIKLGLIKEYLKVIGREKSLHLIPCPPQLRKTYIYYLDDRKRIILRILKK